MSSTEPIHVLDVRRRLTLQNALLSLRHKGLTCYMCFFLGVRMRKFEYKITKHPAENFKNIGFFCTDHGDCTLEQVPTDQLSVLGALLNEKGAQGWGLVQLSFGSDGVIAFWKKEI